MMQHDKAPPCPLGGAASEPGFPAFPGSPGGPGRVLILGAGAMQLPAIRAARQEGLEVVVADGNPRAPAIPYADRFLHIDIKDKDAMLQGARQLRDDGGLAGVFTAATDFSGTVAWVSQELGLPGIGWEVACNASSKARMRRIFREQGIPSPRFVEIPKTAGQSGFNLDAVAGLSLPVVVKPMDNMGARGVRKVTDPAGLPQAVADAMAFARGGVIIEEFIEGPEYSIDSLVIDGRLYPCGLADRHICFPPYFIEVGHTIPTALPAAEQQELVQVFARAVQALGIRNGVAKGDVFMTSRGPVIGEIAARLSGGYMSGWTFPWSSGIDLTRLALRQALGHPVTPPRPAWDQVVAERALISIPGMVAGLTWLKELDQLPGVKAWFPRFEPGQPVIFPRNNVEKSGNIIARAATRQTACACAEAAVAAMVLDLVPGNESTETFLFDPGAGQPRAFGWLETAVLDGSLPAIYGSESRLAGVLARHPAWPANQEKDWSWRTLETTLAAVARLRPEYLFWEQGRDYRELSLFLLGLARGGLQGGLYVLDCLWGSQGTSWRSRMAGVIHGRA